MGEGYKLIWWYSYGHDKSGKNKEVFGDDLNRSCMYCGESKPQVTFGKEAHVIPAGLGNRTLFNLNECDTCNEHVFGSQENELINYLTFDRIFIRGKKRPGTGSPKYKPAGENSYMESILLFNQVHIHFENGEGSFEVERVGQNQLRLKIENLPEYREEDICKCLTHMAWPIMSQLKKREVSYVPNWLLGKMEIFPLYLDVVPLKKSGFAKVILQIWEAVDKQSDYPFIIRFIYGFKILTFYLPLNPNINKQPNVFEEFPQICEESVQLVRSTISDSEKCKQATINFTFSYEDKEEIPKYLKEKLNKKK